MGPFFYLLPAKLIRWLIRPYRTIGGFLTEAEAVALFRGANRLRAGSTVVEIGSWKGKSTFCLARGMRGGTLHAIDPFNAAGEPGSAEVYARNREESPLREQFEANTRAAGVRTQIHQGFSRDFVDAIPGIDFLLIDGDHSIEGARFDFEHFGPRIRRGGWLAFHDYYPERTELGPTWVIENLVEPSGEYRESVRADSLWIGRKS